MRHFGDGTARRIAVIALSAMAVVATAAACAPTPAPPEPTPIGMNQTFTGYVNGSRHGVVVDTFCPGPTWEGRHGPAVAGQTVSATRDPLGQGNTGDNGAVFIEPNTNAQFAQLRNWDEAIEFPTDIDVPCDGPGTIIFNPCLGIVGCRGDAQADIVEVTFRNTAR